MHKFADNPSVITIIETELGPLISESRATVYDVMEAHDEGCTPSEIGRIYNLSPYQVQVALDYIEKHRASLEPQLKEILSAAVERERYHRALVAEIEQQKPMPVTPKRAALNALIEKKRRARSEIDADHNVFNLIRHTENDAPND